MGIFDIFSRKAPPIARKNQPVSKSVSQANNDRTLKEEKFYAVGTSYYAKSFRLLAETTPDWKLSDKRLAEEDKVGCKIYRYRYINKPVKLIPEPTNKHDRNAVQVVIAGELVGYISQDDNKKVLDILNHREIKYISSFISGGEYKVASYKAGSIKKEETIKVSVKIGYV